MLYHYRQAESPRTPPQKDGRRTVNETSRTGSSQQGFVNALNTPVTESRYPTKLLKTPSDAAKDDGLPDIPLTPFFTPRNKQKSWKRQKGSISKSSHATSRMTKMSPRAISPNLTAIPTNKTKKHIPATKIRPLSIGLQLSLAQEELSSDENTIETNYENLAIPHTGGIQNEANMATTPTGRLINEDLVDAWYGKSLNNDFSSDEELSDYENMMLKKEILNFSTNISVKSQNQQIGNPSVSAPFNLNTKTNIPTSSVIDYATHAEYFNNKTGERIIRELTEEEKKIKPKKLDFITTMEDNDQNENDAYQPTIDDSGTHGKSVGDKFLLNNLNRFMVDSEPKSGLSFKIFEDNGI